MRDSHKGMCNLRMTNNDHCNKKRVITVLLCPPPLCLAQGVPSMPGKIKIERVLTDCNLINDCFFKNVGTEAFTSPNAALLCEVTRPQRKNWEALATAEACHPVKPVNKQERENCIGENRSNKQGRANKPFADPTLLRATRGEGKEQ